MKLFAKIIQRLIIIALFGIIIFISAGHLDYWQGWANIAVVIIMNIVTVPRIGISEDLYKERDKPGKGRKSWDKIILALAFPVYFALLLVGSLDSGRFHWSPEMNIAVGISGIILNIIGLVLFEIAKRQNRYFSSAARIQHDRGQAVENRGLYRFIRHSGYMVIFA